MSGWILVGILVAILGISIIVRMCVPEESLDDVCEFEPGTPLWNAVIFSSVSG